MSTQEYWIQQRKVEADVYTPLGWVCGVLQAIEGAVFFEFLNRRAKTGAFLKMTQARIPGQAEPLAFFAIRREAAILIAPKAAAELLDEQLTTDTAAQTQMIRTANKTAFEDIDFAQGLLYYCRLHKL